MASINISKLGKIQRGREAADPSSGCKKQNSWSGKPTYNQCHTYQTLGKYTEAKQLEIQVLDARNRILGVEHPHTIKAMAHLAATYRNLGKLKYAEQLEIQVLDASKIILGVEHPDTINAMLHLALTYCRQENTQGQRRCRSKFWMQGTEFLEWNTQIQSMLWKI